MVMPPEIFFCGVTRHGKVYSAATFSDPLEGEVTKVGIIECGASFWKKIVTDLQEFEPPTADEEIYRKRKI